MKVFYWNELERLRDYIKSKDSVSALTVGGFDGPHKGHLSLFNRIMDYKKQNDKVLAGVITFVFTEQFIKNKIGFYGEISTLRQKKQNFEKLGFDYLLVIDFSDDFSKIKGKDFLDILRKFCSMQFLAVTCDFHCGYKRDTGVAELLSYTKQFDLELAVCELVLFDGKSISSSGIRKEIYDGNFQLVNSLLIFPYSLDLSELNWCSSSEFNGSIVADRGGLQVYPKPGKYFAKVTLSNREEYETFLYVESDFLRLEIPLELDFNGSVFLENLTFL